MNEMTKWEKDQNRFKYSVAQLALFVIVMLMSMILKSFHLQEGVSFGASIYFWICVVPPVALGCFLFICEAIEFFMELISPCIVTTFMIVGNMSLTTYGETGELRALYSGVAGMAIAAVITFGVYMHAKLVSMHVKDPATA